MIYRLNFLVTPKKNRHISNAYYLTFVYIFLTRKYYTPLVKIIRSFEQSHHGKLMRLDTIVLRWLQANN